MIIVSENSVMTSQISVSSVNTRVDKNHMAGGNFPHLNLRLQWNIESVDFADQKYHFLHRVAFVDHS